MGGAVRPARARERAQPRARRPADALAGGGVARRIARDAVPLDRAPGCAAARGGARDRDARKPCGPAARLPAPSFRRRGAAAPRRGRGWSCAALPVVGGQRPRA